MSNARSSPDLPQWFRLGGWALADQGFFATSNFVLGILLARWMSPTQFGAFTIAQSAFLLFGAVHIALLTEPMLVFGPARFASRFSSYLGHLVGGHWLITGGIAAVFLLAAVVLWSLGAGELSGALLGAAVATPSMLLVWLARRASFASFRPRWAALAGAGYLFLMLTGIAVLYFSHRLSPFYAFLVLGVCSLVVGSVLIRVLLRFTPAAGEVRARQLLTDHWQYGRWAVASSTLSWISSNVYFFALPIFGGLAGVGAFRALLNLVLPMHQVIVALSVLLLPALVHAQGTPRYRSTLRLALLVLVGSAVLYWLILASVAKPLIAVVYGGNYLEYARLLWLTGALPVIAALVAVVSNALRAGERPDLVFRAYAATACVTVTFGLWAVTRWQVTGAIIGELLSGLTTATGMWLLIRRLAPGRAAPAPVRADRLPVPHGSTP